MNYRRYFIEEGWKWYLKALGLSISLSAASYIISISYPCTQIIRKILTDFTILTPTLTGLIFGFVLVSRHTCNVA